MMPEASIIFCHADDWCNVFLNSEYILGGHSVQVDVLLEKLIGYTIKSVSTIWLDDRWLDENPMGYGFPLLEDIPPEAII